MTDDETADEDLRTSFSMQVSEDAARFLAAAYPDALSPQERLRMAVAEVRLHRAMGDVEDLRVKDDED